MAVPKALAEQSVVLPVERPDGPFSPALRGGGLRFGPYLVDDNRRPLGDGTTRVWFGPVGISSLHYPYQFRLVAEGGAHQMQCAVTQGGVDLRFSPASPARLGEGRATATFLRQARRLDCAAAPEGGEVAAWLSVGVREPKDWNTLFDPDGQVFGAFWHGGLTLDVRSIGRLSDGRSGVLMGFEFLREGAVVGAVQTANAGQVWLAPGQPPEVHAAVALAASALLLNAEWYTAVY
jgi:hypothetical protein